MPAVDFEQWAAPELVIPLGGRTYVVQPPSVDDAKKILALAVLAEVKLHIVAGPVPDEVQAVIDTIGADEHPALRDAHEQIRAAGHLPVTLDRAALYAIFYWARGKEYADFIAPLLWAERETAPAGGDALPKG